MGGVFFLVAVVAYIPLSRAAIRRFYRYMNGRRWFPRHAAFYATLVALLYTPGCLELDLRHGNALPFPVPAWVALVNGSIWGGLLPLCVGWVIAHSHIQSRVTPTWKLELEEAEERARRGDPPSGAASQETER